MPIMRLQLTTLEGFICGLELESELRIEGLFAASQIAVSGKCLGRGWPTAAVSAERLKKGASNKATSSARKCPPTTFVWEHRGQSGI